MTNRVTIRDVADLAGVSKVTVSYVLNGRDVGARISSDTRDRVLDAAQMLGYRPNGVARMLATRRSDTIAVVFQYANYFSHWSAFTSEIMHGVSEAAVQNGFDLMLHTRSTGNPQSEVGLLTDGRVDGVLMLRDGDDPVVSELFDMDFPAVMFFTRSYHPKAAFVDADNYAGGRIATQHLIELGHKRIGMIRGSLQSVASNDRFNGYRDAMEHAGLRIDPSSQLIAPVPGENTESLIKLMQSSEPPTALFVWSDDVAMQAMAALKNVGIRIPEDLSIVGFDSLETANLTSPGLTSVRQPIAEMAREATTMLAALIRGEEVKRKQMVYPLSLEHRASTAPPSNLKPK